MALLGTIASALASWASMGPGASVLGAGVDLATDPAARKAIDWVQDRLGAYTGTIPSNQALDLALRLAELTTSLVMVESYRRDEEVEQVINRTVREHPFVPAARSWLHDQIGLSPSLTLRPDDTLLAAIKPELDRLLADTDPAAARLALTAAETQVWTDLVAGSAAKTAVLPPDDFADLFFGRSPAGKPGWSLVFQAFVIDSLNTHPRVHLAYVTQSLATLRTAFARLEPKIDSIRRQQSEDSAKLDELLVLVRASGLADRAAGQGISEPSLRAIVERLGGLGLAREDLLPWLENWIEHETPRRDQRANLGAAYDAARREAERRFAAGEIDEAAAAFMDELARDDAREAERQAERQHHRAALLEAAIDFDTRALNIDAIPAKLRLLAATRNIPPGDDLGCWLRDRADERYRHGRDKGDNIALLASIATFRAALSEYTRDRAPLDWAAIQNNLGNALRVLGERESGPARLEEAVATFRTALQERTRDRDPLGWAMIQNDLGNALQALGERESGTVRLEEAVAAYRAALYEYDHAHADIASATIQNNLGGALALLGEREHGTARLEQAVAAFRAALAHRTRERAPLDWAMTQNNLGNALWMLGEREDSPSRLRHAIDAFRAALEEYTRDPVPLDWAMAQSNLGNALRALGEREGGTGRLNGAVAAYHAALEERTRDRVPLDWAMTQNNLGGALWMLGSRQSGTRHFEEAIAAYRAALDERTRERVPLDWAKTRNNLGVVLVALAERKGDRDGLDEAVTAFHAALEIFRQAGTGGYVDAAESNLERARALLAQRGA